jgi:ElaB/YqjD/DUF883 family membrane-anchored ribosome-binding protein
VREELVASEQAEQQGRGASEGAAGKAREVAGQAKEQVQEKADEVKVRASDRVRSQLDTRSTQLGDQVTSFAEALRKAAEHLQGQGNDTGAKAAHRSADQAERLAGYLRSSSSARLVTDLERFGRQRPWVSGAIGAAIGFVGARFLKASSESRYDTTHRRARDADLPITRDGDASAPVPPLPAGYRSR